ncbi:MAG: hypothetical protein LRY76_07060 [Alphaproteobacteria bacterium]|nr:hypothetical protein [Alphaproteobacteria bacterium]
MQLSYNPLSALANRFPQTLGKDSKLQKAYRATALQIEGDTLAEKIEDMPQKLWRFQNYTTQLHEMAKTQEGADHIDFWINRINTHNKARFIFGANAAVDAALVPALYLKYPSLALNIFATAFAHLNSYQARNALLRGPFRPDEPPSKSDYRFSKLDWTLGVASLGLYLFIRNSMLNRQYVRDFKAHKKASVEGYENDNRRFESAAFVDNYIYRPLHFINAAEKAIGIALPSIPIVNILTSPIELAFKVVAGGANAIMGVSASSTTVKNLKKSRDTKDQIIDALKREP